MRSFAEFVSEQAALRWLEDVIDLDVRGGCIAPIMLFSDEHGVHPRREVPIQESKCDGQS